MTFDNRHYILVDRVPVVEPDLLTWAEWFENADNRVVAQVDLPNGYFVSTIFLGLDHDFFGRRAPVLFETMVFYGEGAARGIHDSQRCSTWDEAEKQHTSAVEKWILMPPPAKDANAAAAQAEIERRAEELRNAGDAAEGHT
jgi:hypothetical protein